MNTIDLTPLYRNSVGFDRLASMLDSAFRGPALPEPDRTQDRSWPDRLATL